MVNESGITTEPSATRQCGRCRARFPGDELAHPTALAEWWLCDPCREALLGPARPR